DGARRRRVRPRPGAQGALLGAAPPARRRLLRRLPGALADLPRARRRPDRPRPGAAVRPAGGGHPRRGGHLLRRGRAADPARLVAAPGPHAGVATGAVAAAALVVAVVPVSVPDGFTAEQLAYLEALEA